MNSKVMLGIPEGEKELLTELGRLAVAHGNLEMVQLYSVKIIERLTVTEVSKKYRRWSAKLIREKILEANKRSSLSDEKKQRVEEIVNEAWQLSENRNNLLHRFWGQTQNGTWVSSLDEDKWEGLPNVSMVRHLSERISKHASKMNDSRLRGEIGEIGTEA